MQKKIKIGNKEYLMSASAFTQFAYKNETGRSFLNDIKQLAKFENSQITIENIEALDEITNLIFPVAYVMTKEADSTQITDYEGFLKSIDDIYSYGVDWISSVILLACSPISGQLQNIKTTTK